MSNISRTWISYPVGAQSYRALCITPAMPGPWPALIVIHGASGLDPSVETVATDFAERGYLAIAPDVYSHDTVFKTFSLDILEAGMALGRNLKNQEAFFAKFPAESRDEIVQAYEWLEHRPEKTYIEPIRACFAYLKNRADTTAIGCIGFCMGGRLTAELAASGAALDAGVIFYGIDPGSEPIRNIRCPLQGHYGVTDRRITGRVPDWAAAMKEAGKDFTYYVYEAGHGFANAPYLPSHNAEAAKIAFGRANEFLADKLRLKVTA